jgi:hypothetical protein
MQTSKAIKKGERPHPALLTGLIAIPLGMTMESVILLAIGAACLAWWLPNICKPSLLRKHEDNTLGETIDLGRVEIPLTECSMGAPKFYYVLRGLPQVTQLITARDPDTGAVSQYLLITRCNGHTRLHPIIEN